MYFPAPAVLVSMGPPGFPTAWLHPCRASFRFAWRSHCNSVRLLMFRRRGVGEVVVAGAPAPVSDRGCHGSSCRWISTPIPTLSRQVGSARCGIRLLRACHPLPDTGLGAGRLLRLAQLSRTRQPFWQRESYDHWIRDHTEAARIEAYIENNAVKAGLAARPRDYSLVQRRFAHRRRGLSVHARREPIRWFVFPGLARTRETAMQTRPDDSGRGKAGASGHVGGAVLVAADSILP